MKKTLGVLCFFASAFAFAAPTIKQINAGSNQVAVGATKETTIGSRWMAVEKSGDQCELEVVQQNASVAILEGKCIFSQLRVGQRLEKSLFTADSNQVKTTASPRWMQKMEGFSAIVFLNTADDISYSTGGTNGTVSSNRAFGLGAEYNYDLREATDGLPVGVTAGLTYEFARDWDSFSENGQVTNFNGKKPNLSIWMPYLNGVVKLADSVGVFGGVNYSVPQLSNSGTIKFKSALGYQLGVSAQFSRRFAADALYRWVNFGANNNISDVSLDGFSVRGRYVF